MDRFWTDCYINNFINKSNFLIKETQERLQGMILRSDLIYTVNFYKIVQYDGKKFTWKHI